MCICMNGQYGCCKHSKSVIHISAVCGVGSVMNMSMGSSMASLWIAGRSEKGFDQAGNRRNVCFLVLCLHLWLLCFEIFVL